MLKVDISVHPFGNAKKAYSIEELYIWNTTLDRGPDEFYYQGSLKDPRLMGETERGDCVGVWHSRANGALHLTRLMLDSMEKVELNNAKDEGDKVSK